MRSLLLAVVALLSVACGSPTDPSSPPWTMTGTGNTVFDRPADVERVDIRGTFNGQGSNFIIWCGSQLVLNELLGTLWGPTTYSGRHQLERRCNPIRIENSTAVAWTFTEVR